jgi:hypothetical protein
VNGNVPKLVSLLNQERLIDDDAIVFTFPFVPRYVKPCESAGRKKLPDCVDEAVEKNPPVRPRTVEVELYPVTDVKGNTCPASVDVETVARSPFEPIYEYPCARDPKLSVPTDSVVAEATANELYIVDDE